MLFECWEMEDGSIQFGTYESNRKSAPKEERKRLVHCVDLPTFEEALAVHHLRMGWGPFKPMGNAEPCPACGAFYYPEGTGACYRCCLEEEERRRLLGGCIKLHPDDYEKIVESITNPVKPSEALMKLWDD